MIFNTCFDNYDFYTLVDTYERRKNMFYDLTGCSEILMKTFLTKRVLNLTFKRQMSCLIT